MFVLSWRVEQSPGAGGVWVSLLFPEWNTSSELQKRLAVVLFLHQTDGFLRFSGIWNRAGNFSPLFPNAWQSHFNFVSLFLLSCPVKYQPDMLSFQTEGVWSWMLLQGSITCLSLGKPAIACELFWPHFKFSSYPCCIAHLTLSHGSQNWLGFSAWEEAEMGKPCDSYPQTLVASHQGWACSGFGEAGVKGCQAVKLLWKRNGRLGVVLRLWQADRAQCSLIPAGSVDIGVWCSLAAVWLLKINNWGKLVLVQKSHAVGLWLQGHQIHPPLLLGAFAKHQAS